jgi:hypothetical protein
MLILTPVCTGKDFERFKGEYKSSKSKVKLKAKGGALIVP